MARGGLDRARFGVVEHGLVERVLALRDDAASPPQSPVMLTAVRIMSIRRSTPRMSAMPSTGRPTWVSTMVSMTRPTPGTPAVPIEASVAMSITIR